jgi:cell division protease FtsH
VRDLFAKARKMAPAIIFIDEVDAAGRKRGAGIGQGNDEREQTLNQLLVEMDGFGGDAGIIVMAATNRPDILDPALLRPGRFDRQVTVDVPDVFGRHEILQLYLKGRPLAPDVDVMEVAKLCPGFSGAELANLVNEAALLTVRTGQQELTRALLEEAIERVVAGPAKKSHVLSDDERYVIAVHEASHAVVSRAIGQAVSAQKLSIVARGRQLGTAAHMLTDRDAVLMQASDMRRHLLTIVAGAAGEQYEFGELSSGVHDDLFAATQLARQMVTSFGMSPALGLVTIGEQPGEVFLGAALQELGSVAQDTLATIDHEVARIVGEAAEGAGLVLQRNWDAVRETAAALLEHETLSGVALDAVLSTVEPAELAELDEQRSSDDSPEALR